MSKTITLSDELIQQIIEFCDDELNYHINESGCADEYDNEITAQIELLRLLGEKSMADDYAEQYNEYLEENPVEEDDYEPIWSDPDYEDEDEDEDEDYEDEDEDEF